MSTKYFGRVGETAAQQSHHHRENSIPEGDEGVGWARGFATGLSSPTEPASGLGPSGFDPSRVSCWCGGWGYFYNTAFDPPVRTACGNCIAARRKCDPPFESALALVGRVDANIAGELLRALTFKGPYGCYSCFDVADCFEKAEPADLPLTVRTALLGCHAETPECYAEIDAFRHRYLHFGVAWHWDGDGSLAFYSPGFLLLNGDCKKDHEWERHEAGDWIDDYVKGRVPYDCCGCGACLECDARAYSRDTDRSGEAGQTAQRAGPEGREPGPRSGIAQPIPGKSPHHPDRLRREGR